MIESKASRTVKFLARGMVVFLVLGLVIVSGTAFKIHLANKWQLMGELSELTEITPSDRILVFSPHPDDETLGCGGMIARAKATGAEVRVVMMTNGDAYTMSLLRNEKKVRPKPADYIEYGKLRQKETIAATKKLGLSEDDIVFLGYPDRGLARLWDANWTRDNLYKSPKTKRTSSPYADSATESAPYCGESLLKDVTRAISDFNPTRIVIPHPCDNHPDHRATTCFVNTAISELKEKKSLVCTDPELYTYIVHRGDWPVPKGNFSNKRLAPPYGLCNANTTWSSLELTTEELERKKLAISAYKTQKAVMPGFLASFVRKNEIFGETKDRSIALVAGDTIDIDGKDGDWRGVVPVITDPTGDQMATGLNRGADIREVYAGADSERLYMLIACQNKLSRTTKYEVNIKTIDHNDRVDIQKVYIYPAGRSVPDKIKWSFEANRLEMSLPYDDISGSKDIFIQVNTRLLNCQVDNTGWHNIGKPRKALF